MLDLHTPRALPALFGTALQLYRSHLLLFITLAGLLVIPFQVASVLLVGTGHSGNLTSKQELDLILSAIVDFALVIPTVSALQVEAVLQIGEGRVPRLSETLRLSARVLPTAVAASIIAGIGIAVGFMLLVLPAIWLAIRLYVVAQTAAVERADWPTTLRRSFTLTRGSSWRIFGMLLIVDLINVTFVNVQSLLSLHGADGVALAVAVDLLIQSFTALLGAILYFDLRAREELSRSR